MNPLEMIDIRQKQMLNSIQPAIYSDTHVKELLVTAFAFAKQAYMSGEFIFELESFDSEQLKIDNTNYKVSKILTEDNKYTMVIQMLNVPEGDMTSTDREQLANALKQAIHNNPHISGVVLLPENYEITLMTAKLNTKDYEVPVELSEEDVDKLVNMGMSNSMEFIKSLYNKYIDPYTGE